MYIHIYMYTYIYRVYARARTHTHTHTHTQNTGRWSACTWSSTRKWARWRMAKVSHPKRLCLVSLFRLVTDFWDGEGFTPLTLAAARGSLHMFNHLISKLMVTVCVCVCVCVRVMCVRCVCVCACVCECVWCVCVCVCVCVCSIYVCVCMYVCVCVYTHTHTHTQMWCYGPVICRKIFLDANSGGAGVDVALDAHHHDSKGQTTSKSVLDVIVENRRLNPKP